MRSKPGIIKLMISLMVDGIGMLSYLLPGGGEIADAIWAPISAGTILLMYGVYYVASHYWFNNPALVESNKTLTMYVVVAAVFIIGFVGMKWKEWKGKL
jgi:hypothetical protein